MELRTPAAVSMNGIRMSGHVWATRLHARQQKCMAPLLPPLADDAPRALEEAASRTADPPLRGRRPAALPVFSPFPSHLLTPWHSALTRNSTYLCDSQERAWNLPASGQCSRERRTDMKADQIIRNASIFTSNPACPYAAALAVKAGNSSMLAMKPAFRPMRARSLTSAENSSCPASSTVTCM